MAELKHINTICNIEFYFEYKNKIYLREQIHGSTNDQFTTAWYEVGKNKSLKALKDNILENLLEKLYITWINDKV
jgi:hypothetical protein